MKGMNKVLAVLSLAVILFAVTPGLAVNAAVSESAADRLFYETLCEIFDYEKTDTTAVSAEKEMVYDITLNELGIAYSFTYGEEQGFALLIDDGELRVTEFYPQGESRIARKKARACMSGREFIGITTARVSMTAKQICLFLKTR